jgi:hypothetical protein
VLREGLGFTTSSTLLRATQPDRREYLFGTSSSAVLRIANHCRSGQRPDQAVHRRLQIVRALDGNGEKPLRLGIQMAGPLSPVSGCASILACSVMKA